jgi:hypothetical protein
LDDRAGRRIEYEPLVRGIVRVDRIEAHPYFGARLSDRRNEDVPTLVADGLGLFAVVD